MEPLHDTPPQDMPLCAWHATEDFEWGKPSNYTKELRAAYYATVSYSDYNVGKVLRKLEALSLQDSTVVVLLSDHGLGSRRRAKINSGRAAAFISVVIRANRMLPPRAVTPTT